MAAEYTNIKLQLFQSNAPQTARRGIAAAVLLSVLHLLNFPAVIIEIEARVLSHPLHVSFYFQTRTM